MTDLGAIGIGGAGTLVIGGVGFDASATVMSQYANSPVLLKLIQNFAEAIDQDQNIDNFYDFVMSVQTASTYGLDVWGRIVVVSRYLTVTNQYLGFDEGNSNLDYVPFNQGPFYSGGATTANYRLSDDAYRQLIFAKAAANICFGSVQGINALLQLLFPGRGPCYVTDNLDMTMTYTFGFTPTPVDIAIIQQANVLPRPSGVKILYSL